MIDEARILEYSGPLLGLLKWAAMMKQFILYTIFSNVLLLPWGLSIRGTALGALGAAVALFAKFLSRRGRCRIRRDRSVTPALLPLPGTPGRLVPACNPRDCCQPIEIAIVLVAQLQPLAASVFSLIAIASLLLAFVMLGSRWLNDYLIAFATESWLIAILVRGGRLLRTLP
jgi:hypothetical protein